MLVGSDITWLIEEPMHRVYNPIGVGFPREAQYCDWLVGASDLKLKWPNEVHKNDEGALRIIVETDDWSIIAQGARSLNEGGVMGFNGKWFVRAITRGVENEIVQYLTMFKMIRPRMEPQVAV